MTQCNYDQHLILQVLGHVAVERDDLSGENHKGGVLAASFTQLVATFGPLSRNSLHSVLGIGQKLPHL